ncbi:MULTISPECIES: MBL fold metallo-hydrolase [Rhodococcus]|uniref:MBL fold metallo-hydrolase n=1 Tax=Rhodococcus jostii TaxID=132919 RepID=A0ABU4CIK1_RHOJO|nr:MULTISPECIES: MBL fold metallo-hydrolase [Rhodococcus]MDV6283395.1 MBL fold metallo-hydrolase [Rhodococcus jostii]MDV8105847.1 MBL fold metallo-hydrolase [Rhodococcus sp. IEGM 69]
MDTTITEIAPDIYRLSTYLDEPNLIMNQFLVDGEEPLLFHTGQRALFPSVSAAVGRLIPLDRLRWITFGHVEADECGAMNSWLAAAPNAEVAHGAMGCFVQVNDLADRMPRPLQYGDVMETGTRRVRHLDTPHVPHGWDAGLVFEETTQTLFCGDLFTAFGHHPPATEEEIVGPAIAAEDMGNATCLSPALGPTIRGLADLEPLLLAPMHAPVFTGDCVQALHDLAQAYEERLAAETVRYREAE